MHLTTPTCTAGELSSAAAAAAAAAVGKYLHHIRTHTPSVSRPLQTSPPHAPHPIYPRNNIPIPFIPAPPLRPTLTPTRRPFLLASSAFPPTSAAPPHSRPRLCPRRPHHRRRPRTQEMSLPTSPSQALSNRHPPPSDVRTNTTLHSQSPFHPLPRPSDPPRTTPIATHSQRHRLPTTHRHLTPSHYSTHCAHSPTPTHRRRPPIPPTPHP